MTLNPHRRLLEIADELRTVAEAVEATQSDYFRILDNQRRAAAKDAEQLAQQNSRAISILLVIVAAGCLFFFLMFMSDARAHLAQSGWTYGSTCCAGRDCREIDAVTETPAGYRVPSGAIIPYNDRRLRRSPDGLYHWCTVGGTPTGDTRCLYVPPRGA